MDTVPNPIGVLISRSSAENFIEHRIIRKKYRLIVLRYPLYDLSLIHILQGLQVEENPMLKRMQVPSQNLEIVYEDPWLSVINKPAGMLSVPDVYKRQQRPRTACRLPHL